MRTKACLLTVTLVGLLCLALTAQAWAAPGLAKKPLARNVIVMISDGCGYNQVNAASLWQYGATGLQVYEAFPFQAAVSTHSASGTVYDPTLAWGSFNWVKGGATDSAAAATALATGVKTNNGMLGVNPSGSPVGNVTERAEALGKATGVITSVVIPEATPAAFLVHNPDRDNMIDIFQAMVASGAEVVMGTGNPWYDNNGNLKGTPSFEYVGGQPAWDALVAGTAGGDCDGDGNADPWTLVQERSQFQALAEGPAPKRVIGVAQAWDTLHIARGYSWDDLLSDPFEMPLNANVPTITELTRAALNVLDDDPDGFFLMVEAGAVDGAAHENVIGRMIEEEVEFNRAVEAVIAWVQANSNWGETLLIVTGDHETGYLTGPGSDPDWLPLANNGAGQVPGVQWNSTGHTKSLIPLYAKGDAGRLVNRFADQWDPVRGKYLDNTEVAQMVFATLGEP